MLVGIGTEDFALEVVGARLGLGNDDRARRIAIFGGVVGADDLIFGDRELRERVARIAITLGATAAGETRPAAVGAVAASDEVFLTDAVDEDVDR